MSLAREELSAVFLGSSKPAKHIGVEIEIAPLRPDTGRSTPYEGNAGVRALLERFQQLSGGTLIFDGDNPVGVALQDGNGSVVLENGGAIELCSAPAPELVSLHGRVEATLRVLAQAGRAVGIALVPGANFPFNAIDSFNWMPKRYGKSLREYFASLGEQGEAGSLAMSHITSTQTTLDYDSEGEAAEMVRTGVALIPVVTALFANSPLEAGMVCGALSRRTQYFFKSDPDRFGFVPPALDANFGLQEFIDWALDFRMIYRKQKDGAIVSVRRSFRDLMRNGFSDGEAATLEDWKQHLSQIYTDVRLRDTIELRGADGPAYAHIMTVPAFWVGLLYHKPSRDAVWARLGDYTLATLRDAREEAATKGLKGMVGGTAMRELASEVVGWARKGLEARIARGLESAEAAAYLDPIEEVAARGETFAERCLVLWQGELQQSPAKYVCHFCI
ncbi:MAG: glutamate-cysteine ligase family protein [Proteobacteria bacterium]|nr:glutamate-cysteine ligase family protein [Pseudomonadota bacterium]